MTNVETTGSIRRALSAIEKNYTQPSSVDYEDYWGMVESDPFPDLPAPPNLPEEQPDVPGEVFNTAKQNPLLILILARILSIERTNRMMYASILATNRDVNRIKKIVEKYDFKNMEEEFQ